MTLFIATFFSQYGAIQFRKLAKSLGIECKLAPVPRTLSSSCGTCAHYKSNERDIGFPLKDLETVYKECADGYEKVFSNGDPI